MGGGRGASGGRLCLVCGSLCDQLCLLSSVCIMCSASLLAEPAKGDSRRQSLAWQDPRSLGSWAGVQTDRRGLEPGWLEEVTTQLPLTLQGWPFVQAKPNLLSAEKQKLYGDMHFLPTPTSGFEQEEN